MLARNSIGRSISLLNDDSITLAASKRSESTSHLPSISSFYTKSESPRISKNQLPLRTSDSHSISSTTSPTTGHPYSRKSSYVTTASSQESPLESTAEYSPALSQRSISRKDSNAETSTTSRYSGEYNNSASRQDTSTHQRKHSNSHNPNNAIPHRPAGPTPLLIKRPQNNMPSNSTVYSNGTTTTSSSKGSASYSSLSSNSSSTMSMSGGSNTHSTNSLSSYSTSTSSSNHSLSSSSSASRSSFNTTPLTPTTPVYNDSTKRLHRLDAMDTHKSSSYGATMLSSPTSTRDPFLYPSGLTGSAYPVMNNYGLAALPNLSVPQQPLPPAISTSSPVMMYSTIDSPASVTSLMDPYLQQSVPNVPFAPYPNELIPGALPQAATQSIAATSPSDTSNTSGPKMAKKKYPCPHAAKYNCSDTFTTSGHAARHGKKHTGEKNIHCPVCDKAFTRKDNMKQHERTHRNKGEASKVAEAVESSKKAQTLSKTSTNSSTEVEMEDPVPQVTKPANDPQNAIRAVQQQRRPQISPAQQSPPTLMPSVADIPMPVTLDSGETLQRVAPSFRPESMNNIFDHSFTSRSQENILGRPAIFERTTSTGSGFSADGEGESPGLDALAMAAELS